MNQYSTVSGDDEMGRAAQQTICHLTTLPHSVPPILWTHCHTPSLSPIVRSPAVQVLKFWHLSSSFSWDLYTARITFPSWQSLYSYGQHWGCFPSTSFVLNLPFLQVLVIIAVAVGVGLMAIIAFLVFCVRRYIFFLLFFLISMHFLLYVTHMWYFTTEIHNHKKNIRFYCQRKGQSCPGSILR